MEIAGQSGTACRRRRFLGHAAGWLAIGGVFGPGSVCLGQEPLFLGVTTSTENSGLLAHLIAAFEAGHDVRIRAVTAGSGAVMNLAARGDVDVILVHSPADEEAFLAESYGVDRRAVMRNRFVIVGPKDDPAGLRDADDAAAAFARLAEHRALFLSRGDESGTHKAELRLWQAAGIDPVDGTDWYRESGSGQGATLNIAANTGAYTLTDDATWATFGNPGELGVLYPKEGDGPPRPGARPGTRQCLQRHPGQPRAPCGAERGGRRHLHGLADLRGRAGGHLLLQGRRPVALLPGGRACGLIGGASLPLRPENAAAAWRLPFACTRLMASGRLLGGLHADRSK